MKLGKIIITLSFCVLLMGMTPASSAENIDPDDTGAQYAWAENVGWLNFEPSEGEGVHVSQADLTGFVWAENVGWVNLDPVYGGVVNDGAGGLSGYAWGENVGWINFGPTYGGVTIDTDGKFEGWAWGENIGWLRFDSAQSYTVTVCMVGLDDLAGFAADWLEAGDVPGNLDTLGIVDMQDYGILASYWLSYCPGDWPL